MSSRYGENISVTLFGQSHSAAVGMTLEGIPAGLPVDTEALSRFLARRAPGRDPLTSPRREADVPEFLCGIVDGVTCGAPITAIVRSEDARSADYGPYRDIPRPGHADYAARVKYRGFEDPSGGGHFSARLTLPLCIAGGICLQLLEKEGIRVFARILSVGDVSDTGPLTAAVLRKAFPAMDGERARMMRDAITRAAADGDSVGGVVECAVDPVPAGLGGPLFGGMESRISSAVYAIPAVKGIEFGDGFASARARGSENNDAFAYEDGRVVTLTNHCGGILGGITDGMPLLFRAAFKPTPSIQKEQRSVDPAQGRDTVLRVRGRHDPCVVLRAVPCVEAAAAIAVYDALLERRKD